MDVKYLVLSLMLFIVSAKCAKILGVFPSPGYSQFILCESLMTQLAKRGHEVTVISAYKPKYDMENYKTILIDGLMKETESNLFLEETETVFTKLINFHKLGHMLTEFLLSHEAVQMLIHSNSTFDVVVVEQFDNEAHTGFSKQFNAPLVMFSSIGLSEWNANLVGNMRLSSINPLSFSSYTNRMNIFERFCNSILNLFDMIYKELIHFPQQQEFLDKYFPRKMCLKELIYSPSILMLNSHASTTYPSSLTTSVVEIGGYHITPKPLPKDIQRFLDEAKNGAVYFSMGSNLKTSDVPMETLSALLRLFSKMKQRISWKFDGEGISDKPKNVLISKWLPQSDILGHPNTRVFITHGGLLSTTEAIFHGVPMIGIPIFGDQKMNVGLSVQKGIAVRLEFSQLSEKSLQEAIQEILENPKYRKNTKMYSNILRDRVVQPLDLAMYWIEYVIRHGGASHLRNSSLELYWFQQYLIDVVGFVILFIVLTYYCIKLSLLRTYRYCKSNIKGKTRFQNKKEN